MSEKRKKPCYFVKCDCGSPIKSILKSTLLDKRHPVSSCGCLVKEKAGFVSDREIALKKLLYIKLKERHVKTLKEDLKEFINFEDFCLRIEEPCYYCGLIETDTSMDTKSKMIVNNDIIYKPVTGTIYKHNGIDRIDSNKGYVVDNVIPCCKYCNIAKSDMTQKEFYDWIESVYNYYLKKEHI